MGFWDRVKGQMGAQFLDVIQWLDDSNDTIVYRFPIHDQAITDQSKLVVREGQAAVFIAEGQLSDVFAPGTYTLDTPNSPIRSFFDSIKYNMQLPFKGDVYFVSTRQFTNNGWGTPNPIMMRDPEFGPVRIRAFGTYSFRVTDPARFMREIVGTDGHFTTDEINGQLKKRLVSSFATAMGQSKIPILDLVGSYDALGEKVRDVLSPKFEAEYGVSLTDITIGNISLPTEVEKALDERSKMSVLGNLDQYTKLKTADALEAAASNPGMAGAGVGMGVGAGMGHAMAQSTAGAQASGSTPPPAPAAGTWHYNGPSGQAQLSTAQVIEKIQANPTASHHLWKAGWPSWKPHTEVPEIASAMPPAPPSAPPPAPGETTWHYHGPSGSKELTTTEVVAEVKAAPDGEHHVWKEGFDGWKNAADEPEIAARLKAGPPAPPKKKGPPPPPK